MTWFTVMAMTGATIILVRSSLADKVKERLGLSRFRFPYCSMCVGFWVGYVGEATLLIDSRSVLTVPVEVVQSLAAGFTVSLASYLVSTVANALETYTLSKQVDDGV